MILDATNERARKIIAAIKALHEACYEAWECDDDRAFAEAFLLVREGQTETMTFGRELEDWSGGGLRQYDALDAAMDLLLAYDADDKAGEIYQ